MIRFLVALLMPIALLIATQAGAEERILSFHADIRIEASGAMEVTETIRVRAEGHEIKRGIYRDFPTDYRGRYGEPIRVGFEVVDVRRDGIGEPWFTQALSNGVRVYIGRKEVQLEPGEYEYQLRYRTDNQLGFFDTHDELYWNVTGNGWAFPIDQVTATVQLPEGVPAAHIEVEGYTGYRGDKGQDYLAEVNWGGDAQFQSTRPLRTSEGLTLVVTWPKGFVRAPSGADKAAQLWAHSGHIIIICLGMLLVLVYYLVVWVWLGRDPAHGNIIPLYQPPNGYSPASMRFIRRMKYDKQTFAAALINLAVKGRIEISENKDGDYILKRNKNNGVELAPGESTLLKSLFGRATRIALRGSNRDKIRAALKAHEASLRRDFEKIYFVSNRNWALAGLALTAAIFVAGVFTLPSERTLGAVFMIVWLSGWSFGVFFLLKRVVLTWWNVFKGQLWSIVPALFITFFSLPFVAGELMGMIMLAGAVSWLVVLMLLIAIGINYGFYEWLKAPTLAGRQLLDQVDGFRDYLSVAEGAELKLAGAPAKTPRLFETYLPYALALDVEQQWSERFADVLLAADAKGDRYQPGWYRGSDFNSSNLGAFPSDLASSLGGAIASASAPGSSSGSGGGGSSGGGGGGGGGGGW